MAPALLLQREEEGEATMKSTIWGLTAVGVLLTAPALAQTSVSTTTTVTTSTGAVGASSVMSPAVGLGIAPILSTPAVPGGTIDARQLPGGAVTPVTVGSGVSLSTAPVVVPSGFSLSPAPVTVASGVSLSPTPVVVASGFSLSPAPVTVPSGMSLSPAPVTVPSGGVTR